MKKLILFITICSLALCPTSCSANNADIQEENYDITISMQINNPIMTVNGDNMEIDSGRNTSPLIVENRTLVPIRAIIEALGGDVSWDEETQTVSLTMDKNVITLVIGSDKAIVNETEKSLDVSPRVINERTMLPIRFIAESFGFSVDWNESEQRITIVQNSFVNVTETETTLENGLSAVKFDGDYMFDAFLENGGAASDSDLVGFLQENIVKNAGSLNLLTGVFGCSAISAKNQNGEALFGRNFDWYNCDALVTVSAPTNGYASIATVNKSFIKNAYRSFDSLPEKIRTVVSLYAPLDGMNEKGLCVAVLYIEDGAKINQSTDKPDITTTTAIRLLLDKAATVSEALELLGQYDMHDSMGMMVHFAIADADGSCCAVEYVNNEMIVTESPVVTNFYLADGQKQGVGSTQSHTRFDILTDTLSKSPVMETSDVKAALESVSKHNFNDGETTEWSIIYNQSQGTASYYHRENYEKAYDFKIK